MTITEQAQMLMQGSIMRDIIKERIRQDELFGKQSHHPAYWLALLAKQMGDLGTAIVDREWSSQPDTKEMRKQAVQLSAVAIAFIEAIDRGGVPVALTTAQPVDPRVRSRALNKGHEAVSYE